MSKPDSDELKVFEYDKLYAVRHNDKILCQLINTTVEYYIAYPILWKSYCDCVKWVEDGCIGEVQEGHQNLRIKFTENI